MELGEIGQSPARKQESDYENGIAPIAALFEDCSQCFERLCATTVESRHIGETSLHSMVDGCFSELRSWGGETGAPDGSLDHALRKSSRLQQTTKDLLGDLISTLRISKALVLSYCCPNTHCILCSDSQSFMMKYLLYLYVVILKS